MASVIFRTGSGSISSSLFTCLPRFSVPVRHDSFSGCEKFEFSPAINRRRIRRTISEPQTISRLMSINSGSHTFPEMLPEVEEEALPDQDVIGCISSLKFAEKCFDRMTSIPAGGFALEESHFPGSGSGSGRDPDGFRSGGSNNDNERNKIGAHYRKLLESNPSDPLLLRNYGKFLHEVEGDTVKAEEYYGRAILVSPGDGELLSLYGKLIWDAQRDGERAQYYFDQAVNVSPNDCMVMGSYAQFMWEAEEDDNIEEEFGSKVSMCYDGCIN